MTRPSTRGVGGWAGTTSPRGCAGRQAVTGERLEAQPTGVVSAGDVELQIVRTVPEKLYEFAPSGDFRIIEAYSRALRSAQHLVYLENQFLWSPEIVNILASDRLARSSTSEAITNPGGLSGGARGNPRPA